MADGGRCGGRCIHILLVALLAHFVYWTRERFYEGGIAPEKIEELPEQALVIVQRLNLTRQVEGILKVVEDMRKERQDHSAGPGHLLRGRLKAKHPVVMVPGVISCGLEVWKAGPCYGDAFFGERLWGGASMVGSVLHNISCWMDHLELDPATGVDPPWKDLRCLEGMHGADYFAPGYWIWAKFIESAAAIGYRPGNFHLACFDWRLSMRALEKRDQYFSHLRSKIETMVRTNGEKAVLIGHSMGANVALFFLQWVSKAAGPEWVATHIQTFVPLAGALLGAIAPLAAFLSGEMQATSVLGPLNNLLDRQYFAVNWDRARTLYRTLGSLGALLPKGGDIIWGNATDPTDVAADLVTANGEPFTVRRLFAKLEETIRNYPAIAEYERELLHTESAKTAESPLEAATDNPLAAALPVAPEMQIFCLYGTGIPTERAYWYGVKRDAGGNEVWRINYTFNEGPSNLGDGAPLFESGTATTDGDGTVPLMSMGYPCVGAWRELGAVFNPGRSPVIVKEYPDKSVQFYEDPRGGPGTGRHVEILGNSEALTDLLYIIAGEAERVQERIVSDIPRIASRVTPRVRAALGMAPAEGAPGARSGAGRAQQVEL